MPNRKVKIFSNLLGHLDDDKHNKFWIQLYAFINKLKKEKPLGLQTGVVSKIILNKRLKNKFLELIKI